MLKSTIKQGGACDWIFGFLLTALPSVASVFPLLVISGLFCGLVLFFSLRGPSGGSLGGPSVGLQYNQLASCQSGSLTADCTVDSRRLVLWQ